MAAAATLSNASSASVSWRPTRRSRFSRPISAVATTARWPRPGSDYQFSLNLLQKFKQLHPDVPTKSGLMLGLGETDNEILQVMRDMRAHGIDMLTIGQYLAPTNSHLPVRRYVHPDTFKMFEKAAGARRGRVMCAIATQHKPKKLSAL